MQGVVLGDIAEGIAIERALGIVVYPYFFNNESSLGRYIKSSVSSFYDTDIAGGVYGSIITSGNGDGVGSALVCDQCFQGSQSIHSSAAQKAGVGRIERIDVVGVIYQIIPQLLIGKGSRAIG